MVPEHFKKGPMAPPRAAAPGGPARGRPPSRSGAPPLAGGASASASAGGGARGVIAAERSRESTSHDARAAPRAARVGAGARLLRAGGADGRARAEAATAGGGAARDGVELRRGARVCEELWIQGRGGVQGVPLPRSVRAAAGSRRDLRRSLDVVERLPRLRRGVGPRRPRHGALRGDGLGRGPARAERDQGRRPRRSERHRVPSRVADGRPRARRRPGAGSIRSRASQRSCPAATPT